MIELPAAIGGRSAWYGPDIANRADWIEHLSPSELAEIEGAAQRLGKTDMDWQSLGRDDFPLPTLKTRISNFLYQVLEGRGFVLLRGLPIEQWGRRLSAIAFLGLGLYWGNLRSQNRYGHLLGHVKDLGFSSQDPNVRIYQTRERQNYHTDSCDVVGLLCLHPARSGGLSSLVSSVTIFNEMRERRPDLARVLFERIETDRRGEVPAGHKPFFCIPVFNWHAGLLSTVYQRSYIESARRFPEVPPLTPIQIEALDLFDQLANDPALHFCMELKAGDIQVVHNHTLLHDRTAFEDWPEPERKRHLLRLWLAPENARPLPPVFAERYGSVIRGQRGGVTDPATRYTIPWETLSGLDDHPK
jgi:Taurine catabolism dioxygenase TauD, TfdA family